MNKTVLIAPGIEYGDYPERPIRPAEALDKLAHYARNRAQAVQFAARKTQLLSALLSAAKGLSSHCDASLDSRLATVKQNSRQQGFDRDTLIECFALIREFSGRVLGMQHHPPQLLGGWLIANGMLAEMQTGEGKTLTAGLPAAAAAIAGMPVHVITANDYLAQRDAQTLAPLYSALGLSVGTARLDDEAEIRQSAYACDITYCTAQTITFDYLRDKLTRGSSPHRWSNQVGKLHQAKNGDQSLMLRGLCYAVVDEADSIFIDEARTPLILSQSLETSSMRDTYVSCLNLVQNLEQGEHYQHRARENAIQLTDSGKIALEQHGASLGGVFSGRQRREFLALQALRALHCFTRDQDYIVRDEKVVIVDPNTGRAMPDRGWDQGLQQLIEIKEHCPLSDARETLAQTTYQRFFRRYLKLGGMTGTASEVAGELRAVYRLAAVQIKPFKPNQRVNHGLRMYASRLDKYQAIAARVREMVVAQRPILIGTASVAESERLVAFLRQQQIATQLLNARQDEQEAEHIAVAGRAGTVTVSTNIAGRGTDIKIDQISRNAGGLHVIIADANDSRRIDRQLYGRAARQGDPGSFELILALEDSLIARSASPFLKWCAIKLHRAAKPIPATLGTRILNSAQLEIEVQHRSARRHVLREDERLADTLAFVGPAS